MNGHAEGVSVGDTVFEHEGLRDGKDALDSVIHENKQKLYTENVTLYYRDIRKNCDNANDKSRNGNEVDKGRENIHARTHTGQLPAGALPNHLSLSAHPSLQHLIR